jgi:hypothetical protein
MKLRKIELGLEGNEFWPKLSIVQVAGVPEAAPLPNGLPQKEAEEIIRSWDQAAILKITPADNGALVGFWISDKACQYLNVPVETTDEGLFAMKIGNGDVSFFVVPRNHETNYTLELIEVTGVDNPAYANVNLY